MKFKTYVQEMRVKPDTKVILSKIDPGDSGGMKTKAEISSPLEKNLEEMAELQYKLYAENKRSILVVFQAMDAIRDGAPAIPSTVHRSRLLR